MTFNSSKEVFDWLGKFVNLEQGAQPPMRAERMEIIARAAGNPEKCAPAVHIAGSKGKGSVTAMASEILAASGKRVARYLSPHIVEYRERITLNDEFFDEAIYVKAGNELREIEERLARPDSEEYAALKAVSDGGSPEPTFFELLTLYYFLCAKEAGVDVLAVETGMGGRLDPTNIAQSVATAITVIELEHTDMLGTTIKQIAREKAGIIKENCPLVLAEQTHSAGSDALDIFIESARAKHAPLLYFPDTVELQNVTVTRDGTRWTLIDRTKTLFPAPLKLSIKLCGEIQAKNTSLAILAVRKAFPEIAERTIVEAVSRVRLPARFEKVLDDPPVIIDGAHTEISVRLCAQTFTSLYGPGGILLFGCAAGKDASAMAKHLIPHFSIIIITTPGTYKVSEPEKVFAIFKEVEAESREQRAESREGGAAKIEFVKDTQEGIARAISIAKEKKLPVLGAGSFYLAAEIRNRVANMLLL